MARPSHAELDTAFRRHRGNSDVSLEEYIRKCRIELGKSLDGKTRVYLDKRYWIVIRNAEMGARTDQNSHALLAELRRVVRSGKAFCPTSEVVTIELLKQSDRSTRRHTARLIDELSTGVCLAPEDDRIGTELAHLFQSTREPDSVYHRDWLVWMRPVYAAIMRHPTNTRLAAADELALQKVVFDDMWSMSVEDFVEELGSAELPGQGRFEALAEQLNKRNESHSGEIRSYQQAYAAEVVGTVGVFASRGLDILLRMHVRDTGKEKSLSADERQANEQALRNVLANALRFGKLHEQLPSLHVLATCHAIYRWDKNRRFEANDFWDFHHAVAALGYCDVFLTENDLRAVVTSRKLDAELGCMVISDTEKAVEHLRTL